MAKWTRRVGVFTVVLAVCAVANVAIIFLQLGEMHTGGIDTHNLAEAASHQASSMADLARATRDEATATGNLRSAAVDESTAAQNEATALDKLRLAGEAQALSMDHLRAAGEEQARATERLRLAGEAQAAATRELAADNARQLDAIKAQADAARAQSIAVQNQADATVAASKATDRLAAAGQAQSNAVLQTLEVAKTANEIAARASAAADRPWARISMPTDVEPAAGQDYVVPIDISNVGRSPATDATASVDIRIVKADASFPVMLDTCANQCQRFTLFPSAAGFQSAGFSYKPMISSKDMTADQVKRIQDKSEVVVVRFRIDYADSSGGRHITNACYFLIPKFGFTACQIGNVAN